MHVHPWLLPVVSLLMLTQAVYLGVRSRAGLRPEEIPGKLRVFWMACFVLVGTLAVIDRFSR